MAVCVLCVLPFLYSSFREDRRAKLVKVSAWGHFVHVVSGPGLCEV